MNQPGPRIVVQKSSISKAVARSALLLLSVSLATAAAASAPVVEGQPSSQRSQPPILMPPGQQRQNDRSAQTGVTTAPYQAPVLDEDSSASREGARGSGGGDLLMQVQQLQQEVMSLRGMVESQQHAIARLQRESRERYLDLDRRLSRLGSASTVDQTGPLVVPELNDDGSSDVGDGEATPDNERAAYEAAFELTREREFAAAIDAFEQFIADYPDGDYEPNAWYWLGELHLASDPPDLEAARQAFVQVTERWPEHAKVADALYKLGVVYHRLDDAETARTMLERVQEAHPNSSAARLASNYLERL